MFMIMFVFVFIFMLQKHENMEIGMDIHTGMD
jgi:hypothetical protein